MGISSSKNREEANVNRDLNLQLNLSVPCPINAEFFYSNIQTLSRCTESLRGFSADSASPSDIYSLTMTGARGQRGINAIMKLFIVNDPLSFARNINVRVNSILRPTYPDTRPAGLNFSVTENLRRPVVTYEAQVYELIVYLEKIKKLLDYNICPYFVKPLGGSVTTSALSIWQNLLQPKGIQLSTFIRNLLIMRFSLVYNLNPNMIDGLYAQTENRPAITVNTDNTVVKINLQSRELTSPEIQRLYAGARPVSGYRYSLNQEIQYDIRGITEDYLNNIQCGYILTEQEGGMKLSSLLLTIKALDLQIRGTSLYQLLDALNTAVRNSVSADIMPIFGRIDAIMAEERDLFSKTKIGDNIRTILNLINRRNRNDAMDEIKKLADYSANQNGNRMLRSLIFQILIACYAMYLSGVAHNDLHIGNVFVQETNKNICYFIDGEKYVFRANVMPKLYDFDRSYVQGYNNALLEGNNTSQNNALLNPKDFVKILCYIRNLNINQSINTYIRLSVNRSSDSERERLFNNFYQDDDSCFLRHRTTAGMRDSNRQRDFDIFHNYKDLIYIFGAPVRNTDSNIPDEWLRTHNFYFIQENFFRDNKLVSADKIDAEILKYGKAAAGRR